MTKGVSSGGGCSIGSFHDFFYWKFFNFYFLFGIAICDLVQDVEAMHRLY